MKCWFLRRRIFRIVTHHRVSMRLLCLAILTGGWAFASLAAQAGNPGWYVGVDAGQSRFSGLDANGSPTYPSTASQTDSGYRLSAGYDFNPYLGVEAGYVNLGKVAGSANLAALPIVCLPPTAECSLMPSEVSANLKTHAWTLEFVGSFPFGDEWLLFGRAGGVRANSELISHESFSNNTTSTSDWTSSDFDGTYGLGLQWSFANDWAARLSWDRYASLGHDLPIGKFDVNLTSLGIVYQF